MAFFALSFAYSCKWSRAIPFLPSPKLGIFEIQQIQIELLEEIGRKKR
jgi:hypothetical protein